MHSHERGREVSDADCNRRPLRGCLSDTPNLINEGGPSAVACLILAAKKVG